MSPVHIPRPLARRLVLLLTALSAGLLAAPAACADNYPNRSIKLISPYAPGGVADPVARALAEEMRKDLGQPVVVENKPGANTMIGMAAMTQAPADGYTAVVVSNAMSNNPALYRKLPYAPKDVRVIQVVSDGPFIVLVNPKLPVRTLRELVDHARQVQRPLTYANVGRGNGLHLLTEALKAEQNIAIEEISYGGKSGEALLAVMKGEVDMMITVVGQATPQVRAGTVRALAVTSPARLPALPDVPTVVEAGYPSLVGGTWYGVAVRADTPEPVVDRLRTAIDKVLANEEVSRQFASLGLVVQKPRSKPELVTLMEQDRLRFKPVIDRLKLELD